MHLYAKLTKSDNPLIVLMSVSFHKTISILKLLNCDTSYFDEFMKQGSFM